MASLRMCSLDPITVLMRVRRPFLLALSLAVMAAVLVLSGGSETKAQKGEAKIAAEVKAWQRYLEAGRPHLPATMGSLDRLRHRRGFVAQTSGCQFTRCYVVAQLPHVAAAALPALIRFVGGDTRSVPAQARAISGCTHSPASPDRMICTYYAVLDHNLVAVGLGPHIRCTPAPCRLIRGSEITVEVPLTKLAGSS